MSSRSDAVAAKAPARRAAPLAALGSRVSPAALAASLNRVVATALLEIRLNLGSPAPWVVGLALAALGYLIVPTAPDQSSFFLSWALSHELGPLSGVLLLFLAASLAHRPQRYDVAELQDSKRVASEELIFGRWLGLVVTLAVPLLIQYLATIIGQMIHSKNAVSLVVYATSFGRLFPSILLLGTLSFCLVTLTRVLVLGAGLAGILWFVLYFGRTFYSSALRLDLTQNRVTVLAFTAAVLLWMLAGYRGRRRAKKAPISYVLGWSAALLFTVATLHAAWAHLALPGKASTVEAWNRLGKLEVQDGQPLPDFAWTDQRGKRISLAGLRGAPALLVVLTPKDTGVVSLLERLARLQEEFTDRGLRVTAVFLSEDTVAAEDAVRQAGKKAAGVLAVVTDWGEPGEGEFDAARPTTVFGRKLEIGRTPAPVLLDEDGKVVKRDLPLDVAAWDDLREQLRDRLTKPEAEKKPKADAKAESAP